MPDGSITHAKGLNIGPITDGSSTNYSIYTRAGDIRFGDLRNTETIANTDQLVVADSDGVLKAVAQSSLGGEWEDDGAGGIRAVQANAAGASVNLTDDAQLRLESNGLNQKRKPIMQDYTWTQYEHVYR